MADNEASLLIRIKETGSEALGKISSGLGFIAEKAAVVGAAIVAFGAAGIAAFREQELATNQLTQAMVNQGMFTVELRDKYLATASALQSLTTFGDEQIISAQATLQAYTGQIEVTEQLTQATLDFAAAKGIDLKSAAEILGKTIGGETNMLGRYGIEIDTTVGKSEKLAQVIEQVSGKFGGQAAAQAANLGSLSQLKNALSDVLEVVGQQLAPFISFFTKQLMSLTVALQSSKDFSNGLAESFLFLSKGVVIAKNIIMGLVEIISSNLATTFVGIQQAMQGNFSAAIETLTSHLDNTKQILIDRKNQTIQELSAIDEQQRLTEEAQRAADLAALQQSEANKTVVAQQEKEKRLKIEQEQAKKLKEIEDKKNAELAAARNQFLNQMASLQNSNNKALAAIGKAAAIAQITINTAEAASSGSKWGMALGGPPLAAAFAGLAWAAGAAQIARVNGVQLAEGGIVRATPGGIQATIGEGGRDEAVIPLDSNEAQGRLGGSTTIIFNGPILGDENQAMEFARAIDRSLLKLRQSNQSVAFETDIF